MSPLTEPLSRPALPQVEGAGDFSIREYEQVAGAITETGTLTGHFLGLNPFFIRKNAAQNSGRLTYSFALSWVS